MSLQRFLGPPPDAPATVARLAAYVAAAGWLGYATQKIYMAAIGKLGMPGGVAPERVQVQYDHPSLAQAGNAALGVLTAVVVLATVQAWARRIPARVLLTVLAAASVPVVAGVVITLTRLPDNADGAAWWERLDGLLYGVQVLAWLVVVATYARRTRAARAALASRRSEVAT
jgi:hypothetical protein